MSDPKREQVVERALYRCEYCHYPEAASLISHQIDHVIPRQHGGSDEIGNLALACALCNRTKGPNLASLDPETREVALLYNPRTQDWLVHFRLEEDRIVGLTPTGRTTVNLLRLNDEARVFERRLLIRGGRYL